VEVSANEDILRKRVISLEEDGRRGNRPGGRESRETGVGRELRELRELGDLGKRAHGHRSSPPPRSRHSAVMKPALQMYQNRLSFIESHALNPQFCMAETLTASGGVSVYRCASLATTTLGPP
jgi:hypothetical protein